MQSNTDLNPLAYSVPDAARLLGLSPRAIYNRIATGEIRSFKVGPRRLISRDSLREFIANRESEAA